MKVWVYSGLPGAGKTKLIGERHAGAPVCSSDHHFTREDGSYVYVPTEIGIAHAKCLVRFVDLCRREANWKTGEFPTVVVDNTNTSTAEIAPYAAIALAYGHELQLVTVLCDPEVAFARNTHGVTLDTIKLMHEALRTRQLAPWWPHEVVS